MPATCPPPQFGKISRATACTNQQHFHVVQAATKRYGEGGAVIINLNHGNWIIRNNQLAGIKIIGVVGKADYAIGISKKNVSRAQMRNSTTQYATRPDQGQ